MKIKKITKVGKREVYDLSVDEVKNYVLENGVITHNTGIYYSADTIFVITKSKEKTGKDVTGYSFNIGIEKSRFVKDNRRIPILVDFQKGINPYSGLLAEALDFGIVTKPKNGWYTRNIVNLETGEILEDKNYRAKETECVEFWQPIMKETDFKKRIREKYALADLDEMVVLDEDILGENDE